MRRYLGIFLFHMTLSSSLTAHQTIAEKKESFHKSESGIDARSEEELKTINEMLIEKRFYLKTLYEKAQDYYFSDSDPQRTKKFLQEIQKTKKEISEIEEMWRDRNALSSSSESYSLWHQPESTLSQLVMDYGTNDFLYLIPPEIGNMRISINSNLPIPKEAWSHCLELILAQNGVGTRELSPYVKELYLYRSDLSHISHITANPEDLNYIPDDERICFVVSPSTPDPTVALHFLQKFSNPSSTVVELIRNEIYLISRTETIKELLKIYDFFKTGKRNSEYQLVTLTKVEAQTMINILDAAFYSHEKREGESMRVLSLEASSHSLFLYGSKDEVSKAIALIKDVESQIEDPREKTLFWYTAKHSDAEELASLLAKVYDLLVGEDFSFSENESEKIEKIIKEEKGAAQTMVVQSPLVAPKKIEERTSHKTADGQNNFIVDPKTGSIIMVIEEGALSKIKELLKKLDVPKKMVQIEVLLFEKKVSNQNKFGLNLLRIGSSASGKDKAGASFGEKAFGIMEFLISHGKVGNVIPAFDLAYKFLLGQDDVQINASPSVLAVNQTPATIAIVEEISINTSSESDDKKIKTQYSRAQYGITLQITPTINVGEEADDEGFITLDTDITFDTTSRQSNDRPDVTRRHIKNHVRIADGQTVILGGLRRKINDDHKDSIPFLGEIPGLGKLFSMTDLSDSSTEMFLFITPKIIYDPVEDLEKIKKEELLKRAGDLPEFILALQEAKKHEKKRLCEGGLVALFGKSSSEGLSPKQEYDGK